MKKLFLILSAITLGTTFNSCDSDDDNNNSGYSYKVRMTDAPAPYDEVNIDLQAVEVISANGQTVTLNTTAGMYNLLDLSNGVSTLIATSTLADAQVSQIRLILGSNNTVVINGTTYPLSTPSADQSGLKILVNQTLTAGTDNEILIDFDAYASIVQTGAGTYKLKPVLRRVDTSTTGRISGNIATSILLNNFFAVTATSATNVEYSSSVDNNGQFQISGLPAGTYTFTATSRYTFVPTVIANVNVQAGSTTNIGQISFTN